ncbi:MAG: hypothetical protein ACN6QC_21610, partial [Paraburkholderia hospita]
PPGGCMGDTAQQKMTAKERDALRDHRDCAAWIGRSYPLNLAALGG